MAAYGYTRDEFEYLLSGTEYKHFPEHRSGYVDLSTFAEVCANRITAGFKVAHYVDHDPDSHWVLTRWIKDVVRKSACPLAVTVATLALIERFQKIMARCGSSEVNEVEGVCRLFLAVYMVAAKFSHDEQPHMTFWTRVSRFEFCHTELAVMERQFLEMVKWRVAIDPKQHERILVKSIQDYDMLETRRLMANMKNPPISSIYKDSVEKEFIRQIPVLDREDEELFRRALTSPRAW